MSDSGQGKYSTELTGNTEKKFIRPSEICKVYEITSTTLLRWADAGQIEFIKTPGGNRLYNIESIFPKSNLRTTTNTEKSKISYCYCRVSTLGQKNDLERQIEYMRELYPRHIIISDIASGINFKRKGIKTILDNCFDGNVEEIVVAYKDRLCRFGFELFEWIFSKLSVKIVVLNSEISDPEKDLTRDLLSIINVFSARINGRRKYKNRKKETSEEQE